MNKELQISTGVVKNASGSAYVELGNMKILCSVQGPRDSYLSDGFNDRGKLFCDFKYAPFSIKGVYKEMTQDREIRSISSLLERIIVSSVDVDSFPKSVVEVYIMAIEVDGDPLCLATMCASLALADAGIRLFGMLGCCCSVMRDNTMIVNPSSEELKCCKCATTLSMLNSTKEITYVSHSGAVTPQICAMSITKCMEEASRLCESMKSYLLENSR
ncbi:hypothetical protein WA556_001639 [Blastocystis sp. ATCC 50177/Nand II]